MFAKFGVLIVLVLVFGFLGYRALGGHELTRVDHRAIALVPSVLGRAPVVKRWRNHLTGGRIETGALYAAGVYGAAPVLLDFYRNTPRIHNGIACFLDQGDTLVSQRLMRLRTAHGFVVFDVAVTHTLDQVHLIAATECTSKGCTTQKIPLLTNFWKQWNLQNLLGAGPRGVVPAAVILTRKVKGQGPRVAAIAALRAELLRVTPYIDFSRARRLAAAQATAQ
jgi:hypothetical protein